MDSILQRAIACANNHCSSMTSIRNHLLDWRPASDPRVFEEATVLFRASKVDELTSALSFQSLVALIVVFLQVVDRVGHLRAVEVWCGYVDAGGLYCRGCHGRALDKSCFGEDEINANETMIAYSPSELISVRAVVIDSHVALNLTGVEKGIGCRCICAAYSSYFSAHHLHFWQLVNPSADPSFRYEPDREELLWSGTIRGDSTGMERLPCAL